MGDLKYALHIQRANGKAKAQPEIRQNVYFETHNRICFAWVSEGVPASKPLHDCNISLHPNGVSVTGVERDGEIYQFQEWWLSPLMVTAGSVSPIEPITPSSPDPIQEPAVSQDSSTLSEVKQAFEAIQAAKETPEDEDEIADDDAEIDTALEEAELEHAEELEIMEELGIADDLDDEEIDTSSETNSLENDAEEGIGGFDDLAVLSDSELNALADEPAPEGTEDDDMASIDGIDNVLDDAINEVLVDSEENAETETSLDDPEEKSGGVESAMSEVLKAAMKKTSDDEDDDMMLGGEEEAPQDEVSEEVSIMSTDEINAMLGDDVPPEEDDKGI
ncbi:MAG: hypothetical protein OQJ97_11860 [Rhodospirillales bacterium]|nr:hypothetical protein [Rhodospirillales bacterium]